MKFKQPKNSQNPDGKERRVGLEIEYSNLPLEKSANIVQNLFGGKVSCDNDAVCYVKDTDLGDFTIELDAALLKRLASASKDIENDKASGSEIEDLVRNIQVELSKTLNKTGAKIAPFEIVAPPVALSKLPEMEKLRTALFEEGAKDTEGTFYYAFGFQINPEVASYEPEYIVRHIQSFLLLEAWLKKKHEIDLSRRISSFIDPFPKSYFKLVLDTNYKPDLEQLIRDYHEHNPTRNRALDMLPLFAHLDEELVNELFDSNMKNNPRPTFHYRFPNCKLSSSDWSFALEWNRWMMVEKLAEDKKLLQKLIGEWQEYYEKLLTSQSDWIELIEQNTGAFDD